MSNPTDQGKEYVFFAANHQKASGAVAEKIFHNAPDIDWFFRTRLDYEIDEHKEQIESLLIITKDLYELREEQDKFVQGTILALSVLDEVAAQLGIAPVEFRRSWVLEHYRQSQLMNLQDINNEYTNIADYYQLLQATAQEVTTNVSEQGALYVGFCFMIRTGRKAIVSMKLSKAAEQADEIMEDVDIDAELDKILSGE